MGLLTLARSSVFPLTLTVFLVLAVTVKSQNSANPLCTDFINECSARALGATTGMSGEQLDCHIRLFALNCSDEYLCECVPSVTANEVSEFQSTMQRYLLLCAEVEGHDLRSEGLSCIDRITLTNVDNPSVDTELETEQTDLTVHAAVQQLDAQCPGYAQCLSDYTSAQDRSNFNMTNGEWSQHLCNASRNNIKCMETIFCACGQGENLALRNVFASVRTDHESRCLEELDFGYLHCPDSTDDKPPPKDLASLCQYPVSTCEQRQNDHATSLQNSSSSALVICELTKVNTVCIEDLLCECPGNQQAELVQQYNGLRLAYVRNCSNVEGHDVFNEEIRCKDRIIDDKPENKSKEIELSEVEGELSLDVQVRQVDQVCPGYEHCFNQTRSYNNRAAASDTEGDMRVLLCEGSRLNILCLDDVLCSCGWSTDQVSKQTLRSLRHNHEEYCEEDLSIGYLTCDQGSPVEKPGDLCNDLLNTCERRVISHYKQLHANTDYEYISCETFKVRVQCLEDYICKCPEKQTESLMKNFDSYRSPYQEQCEDVTPHQMRTGDIFCKAEIKKGTDNAKDDLVTDEVAEELSLLDEVRHIDGQCPGYERCFNVTSYYSRASNLQNTLAGQLAVSCEGSKYTIICLEEALCGCGWGENENFKSILRQMRHEHEAKCNEDLTVGYLECKGCVTTSTLWIWAMTVWTIVICLRRWGSF